MEDIGFIKDAGAVNAIYGTLIVGLTAANNQIWTQDSPNILDYREPFDEFGGALS
jgi:hypothetical protein